MSKICILDEQTINQIAAGEVVENPASVVKELVENAVDAGSKEISVEIRGGGRQLIRISDDGCGMSEEDALLSLKRHATSKIRCVEDLHDVTSMGFRGEAIPSIASISKFMLLTCLEGQDRGTVVLVDGGKLEKSESAARSKGTTIEVKSLFFNVPVRKKFQRSPTYDQNEILKVVTLQALAHPEIKFELIADQKRLLSTSKEQTLEQRVIDVLGREFCQGTVPVELDHGDYKIKGVVGLPTFTRQNRTGQYLFVNKRAIVSPIVSYAISDAYATSLMANRHPVWVLHISMPGQLVDVNVHPQKREVRIRQQQELREALVKVIRQSIDVGAEEFLPLSDEYVVVRPAFSVESTEPVSVLLPEPMAPRSFVYREEPLISQPKKVEIPQVLTTMSRYFVLDAKGEGISIVDQRAAHARVTFEKLQKGVGNIAIQALLIPFTLQLPPPDAQIVEEQLEVLNKVGIAIHASGPNTFMIDAIPQVIGNIDLERLVQDLVYRIREFDDASHFEKQVEKQVALAASRASVSSSKRLSISEAQVLVEQLLSCSNPLQCPLGKSTWIKISSEELGVKFHAQK